MNKIRPIFIKQPPSQLDSFISGVKEKDERKMPDGKNFYVIPESKPYLRSFISSFSWNHVNKTINMNITETAGMCVHAWIESLKTYSNQNPGENIVLVFLDSESQEVGRIRFLDLTLSSHNCNLYLTNESCPVIHLLEFTYKTSGRDYAEEVAVKTNENELKDEIEREWSELDLNIVTSNDN